VAASRSGLAHGFGRALVFVYGLFAFAATGRSVLQLVESAPELPLPYVLSAVAAVIYLVATFALATDRRSLALVAVTIELVGVLVVGATSIAFPSDYPEKTVWSQFGAGYGYVPLVLPMVGLWWLLRGSRTRPDTDSPTAG
jgi:cytochrome bd-type quinol oxidase subunit 2